MAGKGLQWENASPALHQKKCTEDLMLQSQGREINVNRVFLKLKKCEKRK
jgi:hypothetical protein